MKQVCLLILGIILVACTSPATRVAVSGDRIVMGANREVLALTARGHTYMINTDGSGESPEQAPWRLLDEPEWSPDGQWIAFEAKYSNDHGGRWSIYAIKSDGSRRQRIAYHPSSSKPAWSPDGTRIAYHAYDDRDGIYISNVECILRQEKCDLHPVFLADGDEPDWSPDGKQIVYGGYHIYTIDVEGIDEPVSLTDLSGCHNPKWSSDGTKIAFSWYQPEQNASDIVVMNTDGSNLVNLTKGVGFNTNPHWSPDGTQIAFISHRDGLGKVIGWEAGFTDAVFLMDADGTNLVRLSLRDDEDVMWFRWYPAKFSVAGP